MYYDCDCDKKIRYNAPPLDFRLLDIILESTIEEIFLAKIPFIKIAKKSSNHKMCCMAYTAPDATKTATIYTANDPQ